MTFLENFCMKCCCLQKEILKIYELTVTFAEVMMCLIENIWIKCFCCKNNDHENIWMKCHYYRNNDFVENIVSDMVIYLS